MTEAILTLMDDRREFKGMNKQLYRDSSRTIHRECWLAKERWMKVEVLENRDQHIIYNKIKELVDKKKHNKNIALKKMDRNVAMDTE